VIGNDHVIGYTRRLSLSHPKHSLFALSLPLPLSLRVYHCLSLSVDISLMYFSVNFYRAGLRILSLDPLDPNESSKNKGHIDTSISVISYYIKSI